MKDLKFYMIIMVLIWVSTSCRQNDNYSVEVPISSINLVVPVQDALLDLNDMGVNAYTFRWAESAQASYRLVFSKSNMLTDPIYVEAGNVKELSLLTESLDEIAADFGFGNGAQGTLYWSAKANDNLGVAAKEIRTIQVKRFVSKLLTPENQKMIKLNGDSPTAVTSFAWDTQGEATTQGYSLVFADNKEMKGETVIVPVGALSSAAISHSQLQDIFMKFASHPFKTKRVFWNVKRDQENTMLTRSGISVDIDPMMIYKDVRGDEVITYKVAKIVYSDGKQQYWLAENLRTKKYNDGSNIENENIMFASVNTFSPAEVTAFGGYYRPNSSMFNKLPAKGWRIPTIGEYRTLYEAADLQEGTYNVLRSPLYYNYSATKADPKVNKWLLGLVTSGQQQGEVKVVTNTNFCYMMAKGIGEDNHRAAMLDHFAIWEVWAVGATVRLIYND